VSASSLAREEQCPASATLPHTQRIREDATAGTAAHAERERNEDRPGFRSEVPLAYYLIDGRARELPNQAHREYPRLGDGWICGTADTVGVEGGTPVVEDFKSGFGYLVEPVERNIQLGFYALAWATLNGADRCLVRVVTGDGVVTEHLHDSIGLMAMESRIRRVFERTHAQNPEVVEGERCWRCPAVAACPAKRDLALALAGEDPRLPTLELTPEAVAKGWERLKVLKSLLGQIEGAYRGFASTTPVLLGNGKTLGEVEKSRESLDGSVVFRVLEQTHGREVALAAVELDATKASIERAVKPIAAKGKGAALVRETLERIRAEGGTTTKTTRSVEEHT